MSDELERVEGSLNAVVEVHDRQASIEMTGTDFDVILLPVAALVMIAGGRRQEEIRRLKGEIRALEEVATHKDCTEVLEAFERKSDGYGDLDKLSIAGNTVAWYENQRR